MKNILVIVVVFLISLLYIANLTVSSSDVRSKMTIELVEKSQSGSSEKIKVIMQIDKEKYKKRDVFTTQSTPGKTVREFEIIPAVVMEVPANQLEILAKQNFVKSIEPVLEVRAFLQDSVTLINATKVWPQQISGNNITGTNVAVCILDTGVNYTHPDLGGCLGTGCRVKDGYDYVNSDTNPMDDNGHGTHVTGIAVANGGIRGVAPNASIIAIKVLNSAGSGTTENIISGIEWCVNNRTLYNISVISMSLGTDALFSNYCDNESGLTGLRDAINSAVGKNITVVAATGNNGNTTSIAAPACIQNTTAVAWSTKTDTVASSSNRNSITDLISPGSTINSTRLSPTSCLAGCSCSGNYMSCSGTSMATPHVAGALALLYQKYRSINGTDPTPSYLQNILNNTGKVISDSGGSNLNFMRIDVYSASLQINETIPPQWSNQSSNVTLLNATDGILLSAYWTDDTELIHAVLSTNETGNWKNASTISLSGLSSWSNFTWSNSSLSNGTIVAWRIYANDTSGNQNVTNNLTFTVIDNISPKYFNITNSTDNIYSSNKVYQFNITWTDSGISKIIFEWNSTENTTLNSTSNNPYSVNKTDLPVSNNTYRWFANDTGGNWNFTSLQTYNVIQNTSTNQYLNIESNGTLNSNKTYMYPNAINVTAWKNMIEGSLILYRNSTQVSTGQAPNEIALLGNGTYNYTVFYNKTQNYSSSSITYYVFVGKGTPIIRVGPLTSVTYPTSTQTGCERMEGDSSSTLTLYRNSTQIAQSTTSPINETSITLGAGKYNYTCTISETENYTSANSANNYRIMNQNTSTSNSLTLTLNGTSANRNSVYPQAVNATGNYTDSVFNGQNIIITLYRDNITINTTNPVSENIILGNGTYNYTYNTSGNANYSSGGVSFLFYQNKAATNITLLLNNTEGNMTFYKNQIVNITAAINMTGLTIHISADFTGNQTNINSSTTSVFNLTNTSNLAVGMYNITAYYNGSNANYSASSRTYFLTLRHQYQNNALSMVTSTPTVVNATNATNVTLTIVTNETITGAINISIGMDNPTGVQISHTGVNKFITIEANFTSNLTYVILNVSYRDTNISSTIDNSSLRLYYWNLTDWLRQDTNGGVNTAEEYVWANMTHFSNFTIGGLLSNGQSCTSASQCSGGYCNSGVCASSAPTSAPISTGGGGGGGSMLSPTQNVTENKTVEIKNETKPEEKTFQVCIQVITPAIGPTGECREFPTPCDVPANWTKIEKCPIVEETEKKIPVKINALVLVAIVTIIFVLYIRR